MKTIIICTTLLLLSGCGATSGTNPTVEYNNFDNAKLVTIQPHGGKCSLSSCLGLGAQWSSKSPDSMFLIAASFLEYTAIIGAELSIDGEKIKLRPGQLMTGLEFTAGTRISTKGFNTEYNTLNKILAANNVFLRIYTGQGYIDEVIKKGSETTKAYNALVRFKAQTKGA
jgi:hypothetical protein